MNDDLIDARLCLSEQTNGPPTKNAIAQIQLETPFIVCPQSRFGSFGPLPDSLPFRYGAVLCFKPFTARALPSGFSL
jgi:hypothetical protein